MDWMCGYGLNAWATLPENPSYGDPIPASRATSEPMGALSTAAPLLRIDGSFMLFRMPIEVGWLVKRVPRFAMYETSRTMLSLSWRWIVRDQFW